MYGHSHSWYTGRAASSYTHSPCPMSHPAGAAPIANGGGPAPSPPPCTMAPTDDTGKEKISPCTVYPTTCQSHHACSRDVPGRRRGGTTSRRRRAPARREGASWLRVLGSVTWVYRDATRGIGIWCLLRYQSVTEAECLSIGYSAEREAAVQLPALLLTLTTAPCGGRHA
jgi:hypothetical protein